MALLLLRYEADCLVPNVETELVSSHIPPELNRSPTTARAVSSTRVQRSSTPSRRSARPRPLRPLPLPHSWLPVNHRFRVKPTSCIDLMPALPPRLTLVRTKALRLLMPERRSARSLRSFSIRCYSAVFGAFRLTRKKQDANTFQQMQTEPGPCAATDRFDIARRQACAARGV